MLHQSSPLLKADLLHRHVHAALGTTASAMPNWLVSDGELCKIVANHIWLHLDVDELLALAELFEESDRSTFDTTAELPALARAEQLHQVLVAHVQELVKINTTVRVLAEGTLLGASLRHDAEQNCLLRCAAF